MAGHRGMRVATGFIALAVVAAGILAVLALTKEDTQGASAEAMLGAGAQAPAPVEQLRPRPAGEDLNGRWRIVNTVAKGPGAGTTSEFVVTIAQKGYVIESKGAGLAMSGWTNSRSVVAGFTNGAQTGQFTWRWQPDGTLSGTFRSDDGNVSGGSVAFPVQ